MAFFARKSILSKVFIAFYLNKEAGEDTISFMFFIFGGGNGVGLPLG